MKKWWMALAGIATYVIGIGLFFSHQIMFMKKKEEAVIRNREISAKRLNEQEYEKLPKTEITVTSPGGYPITCVWIEPHLTKKWVIICHGVTENKINSIRYSTIFLKRGFNTVIYDHRRHGESGGKTTSYGHYEKFDLKAVVDELKKQKGPDLTIGIHGESMGAATLLLYAGMIEDGADFYIADCPYSNFEEQVKYRIIEDFPFPPWMVLPIGRLFIRMRDGYWINKAAPIDYVQTIKQPVLFIHSEPDLYIPVSMTKELYEAKQGPKQLYIAAKGGHAQSYNENSEEYEAAIDEFLKNYHFL
jgi:uncharacterized protein